MHLSVLPHLATSAISIEEIKKGSLKAHKDFCLLVFPGFVHQSSAWIKDEKEAPVIVGHILIKFWIASGRMNTHMEMYTFLDRTIWKDCQVFNNNRGPADAPIKLIYQQLFDPVTKAGVSDEELWIEIANKEETELHVARTIFNLRYTRNFTHEKIQQQMDMGLQEVLHHERVAMQLLYLLLSNNRLS